MKGRPTQWSFCTGVWEMPGPSKDSSDVSDLPLFQRVAYTPYSDEDTSLEAAFRAVPRANTDEHRVLDAILAKPDTDEGLGRRLKLAGNSLRPRRRSLEQKGLIEHNGAYAKTLSGRRAKIWQVTR